MYRTTMLQCSADGNLAYGTHRTGRTAVNSKFLRRVPSRSLGTETGSAPRSGRIFFSTSIAGKRWGKRVEDRKNGFWGSGVGGSGRKSTKWEKFWVKNFFRREIVGNAWKTEKPKRITFSFWEGEPGVVGEVGGVENFFSTPIAGKSSETRRTPT